MVHRFVRRKCKHCKRLFVPDPRNVKRQRYCGKPECRKASKKDSQQRWLQKPENKDYFRGPENVGRVQQWRKDHPGYWRKDHNNKDALQDDLSQKATKNSLVRRNLVKEPLQDILFDHPAVIIGLIAQLTGHALQDDIAMTARRLQQLGNDFLHSSLQQKGGNHGTKISCISPTGTQNPQTVQLGGSSFGP